jgi:hypothetical protein
LAIGRTVTHLQRTAHTNHNGTATLTSQPAAQNTYQGWIFSGRSHASLFPVHHTHYSS